MAQGMILRRGSNDQIGLKIQTYASAINLPATAPLNQIAVITANSLETVYSQSVLPATPIEGDLWIKLSYTSNTELNLITNGTLKIYPLTFMQYVSGAWVFVDAYAFYNNTWNKFTQYLYFEGNEYIAQCGGWQQGGHGTLNKYATYMTLYCPNSVGAASVRTVNQMDLTNYTTITLRYYTTTSINAYGKFGLSGAISYTSMIGYVGLPAAAKNLTKVATFDVSNYNGLYYIAVTMNSQEMTLKILDVSAY